MSSRPEGSWLDLRLTPNNQKATAHLALASFFTLVHNFSQTFFTNSIDAENRNAYVAHRLNRELENLRLS
jgi:hypothetical protein